MAVSTTAADPTGTWYRYQFDYTGFPDYPKFGVWPDGYYVTYNMFQRGWHCLRQRPARWNRAAMLTGRRSHFKQSASTARSEWSLLPSDADGPRHGHRLPNYILGEHWSDNTKPDVAKSPRGLGHPANPPSPGRPAERGAVHLGVYRGRCVERAVHRKDYAVGYRNFGDHESLVTNHTVAMRDRPLQMVIDGSRLVRPGSRTPRRRRSTRTASLRTLTAARSADVGSIAKDKQGNMAWAYSTSNATPGANSFPSIRYIGRKIGTCSIRWLGRIGHHGSTGCTDGRKHLSIRRWGETTHR